MVAMYHERIQLSDALNRDAFALLYRQQMAGRFQLNKRPNETVPEMNMGLQVHRVRIRLERGIQPSEEGTDMRALLGLVTRDPLSKTLFAERHPNAPGERLGLTMHRDFKAAADKVVRLVD